MRPEDRATVRVIRRFSASPARVFKALVDPAKAQRWMAAPASGDEIVRVEISPRVGRGFAVVVRGEREGEEIGHSGEYLEVVRPRRLVFTWVAPAVSKETTLVTIDIAPVWSGSELTLKHERVLPAEDRSTEMKWSGMLDAMAALL